MLALVALVVIGGLVWKHIPGSGPIALGGGPRPANWNQIKHSGPLPPTPHPNIGSNHDLSSKVAYDHLDAYRVGREAALTYVDCPEVSSPALDSKRSAWGATGPFYNCAMVFADGSQAVECWFRSGPYWRMIFGVPPPAPGPIQPPIKGSCESFTHMTGRVNFTQMSA